jgi:phosphatidylinositol alpha-mannosyltransferase
MSATLPARLGEPAKAMIVARRAGDPRTTLPAVLGTIVSQTLINLIALIALGIVMFNSVPLFHGHDNALVAIAVAPILIAILMLIAPVVLARGTHARSEKVAQLTARVRFALVELRRGLSVFRRGRLATVAIVFQLGAWVLQWLSCYALLAALGLESQAGLGGAAAVLFAVNVTAAIPVTPANLGVFQAACVAVLTAGYGVHASDALGYGIVLQAVELATAFLMGMPALVGEGITWREVRLRTMHTAPVVIPAREQSPGERDGRDSG